MNQFCFTAWLNYDLNSYLLNASVDKLYIYSSELLNEMQTIRNFSSEIKSLCPSKKDGIIGVICENALYLYFPVFRPEMTLMWKLVYEEAIDTNFKYANFSYDDEFLVSYGMNLLTIWKMNYKKGRQEKTGMESIVEIFKLDTSDKIEKLVFSPNGKYFATCGDINNIIFIWDFDLILNKPNSFEAQGNESNIINFALSHKAKVIEFFFRETFNERRDTPNTLLTIDCENTLRIWQENILKENIMFFHSNTLILSKHELQKPLSVKWITISKQWNSQRYSMFGNIREKYDYGSFDMFPCSLDWLGVFTGKYLKLIQISGLRNQGNNSKLTIFKEFQSLEIFKTLKDVLNMEMNEKNQTNYLELLVRDFKNCLLKIVLNINDPNDFTVINSAKFRFGQIILASFNKENNSFMILNQTHELIYVNPISLFSFPDDYSRLSFYQRKIAQLDTQILDSSQYIFHSKELAIFIDKFFKQIYIVSVTNLGILPFNFSKEFNSDFTILEELLYKNNEKLCNLYPVHLIENEKLNEFTLIVGVDRKLLSFKMIFLLNKIKEIISYNKAMRKNSEDVFDPKSPLKNEPFLLIEEVVDYNLDIEDYTNFKIFSYNEADKTFEVCFQSAKKLHFYKVKGEKVEKMREFNFTCNFKDFNKAESIPSVFYFITINNDIEFYKEDGEFICRFSMNRLFYNSVNNIDISQLVVSLKHLYDVHYLLSLDNYFVIFSLIFDKQQQNYVLNFLTKCEDSNDIYYKRISKQSKPYSYEIFIGKNRDIFVKTADSIKAFHGNFEKLVGDPKTENFDPSNIHARLLKTKNNIPFHHPEFVYELLSLGQYHLVEFICHEMIRSLIKKGYISSKFVIPLEVLVKESNETQPITYHDIIEESKNVFLVPSSQSPARSSFIRLKASDFTNFTLDLDKENPLIGLKNALQLHRKSISLKGTESLLLNALIDFLLEYYENQRSLDYYAAIFLFYVKVFKMTQKHVGNISKQKTLLTKELVWALHTSQQDTLIYECIEKDLQNNEENDNILTWSMMKKYGIVLWYDNIEKIKEYIELIAKNEFKETKDSFKVSLWYILLKKKNILATLFRQDRNQKKTYEFLLKNFSDPKTKSAASKNAYALLAKKKFDVSAAFFLLGGYLEEALNIIINNIQDIQLAVLCCKLQESDPQKPLFKKIIQEHFIDSGKITNDCWLVHIGYILLNQHVNSINCLYEFKNDNDIEYDESGKKSCNSWPGIFEPGLSSFHPSAMILAKKLRDSIKVKRELQNDDDSKKENIDIFESFWGDEEKKDESKEVKKNMNELKEDCLIHLTASLEYYLSVNNPILGLLYYINHKEDIQPIKRIKVLIKRLLTKYLEFLLEEAVVENDWEIYFAGLFEKIKNLSEYFEVESSILVKHSSRKIHLLRSLKYSTAFHLGRNDLQSTVITIEEFSIEVQKLYYYSLFSNAFAANPKYFYLDLIYSCQELTFSLILLVNSTIYHEFQANTEDNFVSLYEFFVFFGIFYLAVNLESWSLLVSIIEEVLEFLKRIEKNSLSFLNENVDYITVFSNLRLMTEKFSNFKQKNKKSLKFDDFYSEIFQNKLSTDYEENFYCDNLEEIDYKGFLFKMVIKYLAAAYFRKNLKKGLFKIFQIETESFTFEQNAFNIQNILLFINEFEHKSYKTLKTIFNKFPVGELNLLIEEIKKIIIKPENMVNSKYFPNLLEIIDPQTFEFLSKLCNFEENFDYLQLKSMMILYKAPRWLFEGANPKEQRNFKRGIEIILLKDSIKGFCVNKYKGMNDEIIVLNQKYLKKSTLFNQLLNRKRSPDGVSLLEDATILMPEEFNGLRKKCENFENKPLLIKIASRLLFGNEKKFCYNNEEKTYLRKYRDSAEEFLLLPENQPEFENKKSTPDVSEVQCIVSHPKLPIFLTGHKGIANIWTFESLNCFGEFETSTKDSVVSTLKFNNFGDKLGGVDLLGNFNLWKFNKNSKNSSPIYSIYKKNICDFCFLSEGSIFATLSQGSKSFINIWDTLLPIKKSAIVNEYINGGTNIHYSSQKNLLIFSNFKKNSMVFYDIRKNSILRTIEIPNVEFKSILLNNAENTLFIGTNEGSVKIFDIGSLEIVGEVKPFYKPESSKKKFPFITAIVEVNKGILVSNSEGGISLACPSIF